MLDMALTMGSFLLILEFDDNLPRNEKRAFNFCHSSMLTTIKRDFGILKKRFKVVDNEPFWNLKTLDMVLAYYIIYNHIMGIAPNDIYIELVIQDQQSEIPNVLTEQASHA